MIFVDGLYINDALVFLSLTTNAEDLDELHNFASKIGFNRINYVGDFGMPHYTLTKKQAEKALKAGAISRIEKRTWSKKGYYKT